MRNYLIYGAMVLSMLGISNRQGFVASNLFKKIGSSFSSGYDFGHK